MSIPDYLEVPLPIQGPHELEHGAVRVEGQAADGTFPGGIVRISAELTGLRVYDVWARSEDGWLQLVPSEVNPDRWECAELESEPVHRLRFWVGSADGRVYDDLSPATEEVARPVSVVPVLDVEPPLPNERLAPHLRSWIDGCVQDVVRMAMLDEWSAIALDARNDGLDLALPLGTALLDRFARTQPEGGGLDRLFCRWIVGQVGAAFHRHIRTRTELELHGEHRREVLESLVRMVRAFDDTLTVLTRMPPVVGPAERHTWLVDEEIAVLLGATDFEGLHQPSLLLRPALLAGDALLLEGVVA